MAIRQESYTIYIRPYIETSVSSDPVKIFADDKTDLYGVNPQHQGGGCPHIKLEKDPPESDFWGAVYESNSLEKIRVKYKELLEEIGEEYIKVEKYVPMDYIVKPNS